MTVFLVKLYSERIKRSDLGWTSIQPTVFILFNV